MLAYDEIGQVWVGLVIPQLPPIEPRRVEADGQRDPQRCGRVSLPLTIRVYAGVRFAAHDSHGFRSSRTHRSDVGAHLGRDGFDEGGRPAIAHENQRASAE